MRLRTYILFLSVFLMSGCAVHSPMSELLMFQEKEDFYGSSYRARYSHAILSVTTDLYPGQDVNRYAYKRNPTGNETRYDYHPPLTLMTHSIFMSDRSNKVAISLGLGNIIGFDATARLLNKTYLSAALNLANSPQGQFVLQRRILDGNPVGLGVGATYLRNYQYVAIDGVSCGLCFPSEEFYTNSVGVRAAGLFSGPSSHGDSRFFLHVTGSVNYDITMDLVYPKLGFALGIY